MAPTALVQAIDDTQFFGATGGPIEPLDVNGAQGICTPSVGSALFNRVRIDPETDRDPEAVVDAAIDVYADREVEQWAWCVGPTSAPNGLEDALSTNGMEPRLELWGMVRDTSPLEGDDPDGVTIVRRPIDGVDIEAVRPVIETGFDLTTGGAEAMLAMYANQAAVTRTHFYVAEDDATGELTGFAGMAYVPETPYGLLVSAATVPEYRGRGIYTGMLRARTARAAADGLERLFTQAVSTSSAPITQKHGFERCCVIELWA